MQFKNKYSCSKSTTARPKPGIFIANILTKVTVQKAIFSMWTRVGVQQRNFAYFKYLNHRHEKFWSQIKFPFLYFFKIRIPTWKTGSASDFTAQRQQISQLLAILPLRSSARYQAIRLLLITSNNAITYCNCIKNNLDPDPNPNPTTDNHNKLLEIIGNK